uniref:Uncharacterized protein n=1 Tax=Compsopogon caeruleus TaxID=31354 RepID=A0A7S1TEW8_9RHOD|mmetsp:Transcript_3858/g.7394  ORF Transcript_3858/g.7394 Transcript_3858/m.7394 type:complete len:198 (+) Transcript_3858:80-673(+)
MPNRSERSRSKEGLDFRVGMQIEEDRFVEEMVDMLDGSDGDGSTNSSENDILDARAMELDEMLELASAQYLKSLENHSLLSSLLESIEHLGQHVDLAAILNQSGLVAPGWNQHQQREGIWGIMERTERTQQPAMIDRDPPPVLPGPNSPWVFSAMTRDRQADTSNYSSQTLRNLRRTQHEQDRSPSSQVHTPKFDEG